MMTLEHARARVARGAAHLDGARPGWFNAIDTGALSMWCGGRCIVGQLAKCHDNFDRSCLALGFTERDASRYGCDLTPREWQECFSIAGEDYRRMWAPLQDAWIEAIADRRLSTASNGTPPRSLAVGPRPTAHPTSPRA